MTLVLLDMTQYNKPKKEGTLEAVLATVAPAKPMSSTMTPTHRKNKLAPDTGATSATAADDRSSNKLMYALH